MHKKMSICDLLARREMGNFGKINFDDLREKASVIADTQLIYNQRINSVRYITANERSSYVIDSSISGLAITSHTNRCVSIIDTASMEKVGEIKRNKRTIWTVAFHPYDSSLIAIGSLDGNVSIYKNFNLYRSHNNNLFLPIGTITSISFHPTYDIVCYAIHHKIILWYYEQDVRQTLNADKKLKIKYAKFNPVNQMLITGILHENRDKLENNMEHFINDDARISATYFLIDLFDIFNTVLESIEFVDYVNIIPRWDEMFLKIVKFASELEGRKVTLLTQKNESNLNYLQDFSSSLIIFKRKLVKIESSIGNYNHVLRILNLSNIDVEISALRIISDRYFSETKCLKNRSDINQDILEEVFRKIHNIVILQTHDTKYFDSRRIFSEFSRYQCKLQAWDFDIKDLPDLKQGWRNAFSYCSLHNDSTVDISRNGKIIISFRELATGCYVIAAHSLEKSTLGKTIYTHKIHKLAAIMSVSISPSTKYILVGVRSDRLYGYFLEISQECNEMSKIELYDNNCNDSISYLKWMCRPGDGVIIGYSTDLIVSVKFYRLKWNSPAMRPVAYMVISLGLIVDIFVAIIYTKRLRNEPT